MKGPMTIVGAVLLATIITITARAQDMQDTCNQVLLIGLSDTYQKLDASSFSAASSSWACSAEARESADHTSVAMELPLPVPGNDAPIMVGGKYGHEQLDKWQKKNCMADKYSFNQEQSEKVLVSALSPMAGDAINAWSECKRHSAQPSAVGVVAQITNYSPKEDGKFTLVTKWANTTTGQKPPKLRSISFSNVQCTPAFPQVRSGFFGFRRESAVPDMSYECKRNGDGRAILTLNTDQGPLVPSPVLPARPRNHAPYRYFCKFSSDADNVSIPIGGEGFLFHCPDLPPDAHFTVKASGTVFPAFKCAGWSAGENNGSVYWNFTTSLLVKVGQNELVPVPYRGSTTWVPTSPVTIEKEGKTPAAGDASVTVRLKSDAVTVWYCAGGALGIKPDFTITVAVD